MVTVVAQGVYVNEARADEGIKTKIHKVIEKNAKLLRKNGGTIQLPELINTILVDIQQILSTTPENEHAEFKNAVNSLTKNPKALTNIISNLPIILNNLAPETKALLRENAPEFKAFIK